MCAPNRLAYRTAPGARQAVVSYDGRLSFVRHWSALGRHPESRPVNAMAQPCTTRFAPSPTGPLHLGHAAAAHVALHAARESGGRFLLRIEDIDPNRCRPEYAAMAEQDLAWLGLHWDGPVRVQSAHMADYALTLDRLRAMGLLYPCFCTRTAIAREVSAAGHAPHAPDGAPLYPGTCRGRPDADRAARLAAGEPHAWRLAMAEAAHVQTDRRGALAGPARPGPHPVRGAAPGCRGLRVRLPGRAGPARRGPRCRPSASRRP